MNGPVFARTNVTVSVGVWNPFAKTVCRPFGYLGHERNAEEDGAGPKNDGEPNGEKPAQPAG